MLVPLLCSLERYRFKDLFGLLVRLIFLLFIASMLLLLLIVGRYY
jgi:hypothetical protein